VQRKKSFITAKQGANRTPTSSVCTVNNINILVSTLLKKVIDFPVPNRDVTNQTLPGLELFNCYNYYYEIIPGQEEFG
jgi:hypothetical protein